MEWQAEDRGLAVSSEPRLSAAVHAGSCGQRSPHRRHRRAHDSLSCGLHARVRAGACAGGTSKFPPRRAHGLKDAAGGPGASSGPHTQLRHLLWLPLMKLNVQFLGDNSLILIFKCHMWSVLPHWPEQRTVPSSQKVPLVSAGAECAV